MFAKAFDVAFSTGVKAPAFAKDQISLSSMVASPADSPELPKFNLALSPHADWDVSLGPMRDRIRGAKSSVLYAVMEPTGQGPVLTSLRAIAAQPTVFSYGTVETDNGLAVQSPDGAMGDITGFADLEKNVPAPFTKEFSGGSGKHIHNKFVIVDFNAANPTVFTGSSNLASGGELANGDSLAMIEDAAVANMFAIEAIALFDHYHFRKVMKTATKSQPLTLWFPGKEGQPEAWWKRYYDPSKIQMRDRLLFAGVPLPPNLAATKNVDWKALDDEAAAAKKGGAKKGKGAPTKKSKKTKKKTAKKTSRKKTAKKARKKKKTSSSRPSRKKRSGRKSTAKKRTTKKTGRSRKSAKKRAR
jgi:hypothetical protein